MHRYIPSFHLQAWFPVQIKNGDLESVGKVRWKKHRKCRYIEEPNCFKTGKPKRIYDAQEDEDDPDAGDGDDDGGTAYDDYDYYDNDENSTSNADLTEYETYIKTLKESTVIYTVPDVPPTTVNDLPSIIEDSVPPKYTTEGPLTDETEELTERIAPGKFHTQCHNRYHTYQDRKYEITTKIKNTKSTIGTTSFEYPKESTTSTFQAVNLTDEQSLQTSSNKSMTITEVKYYTDDYYEEDTQKPTNEVDKIKSTADHIFSSTAATSKIEPVTDNSEIYKKSTIKKSSSETLSIEMTASQHDEWPERYPETKPERLDKLSSLNDLNTFPDRGSIPNQQKTIYTVDASSTDEYNIASRRNDFTKDRTEFAANATESEADYCLDDVTDNSKKHIRKSNYMFGHKTTDKSLTDARLRHIETPPYPKLPVDLRFPTCSGNEDPLDDILSPTYVPEKVRDEKNDEKNFGRDSEKNFVKKKEKNRKNKKHCRRKSTYFTTEVRSSKAVPSPTTERYIANQHAGNKKDAKVVVRIPPSLSDIPVVVMRDPLTQKLSLSLIGAEQDPIQPKTIYYSQPVYHQMFPPPFSYNNIYSPNIPPFSKIYPYEYIYGPNVGYRYDKANYIYPKRLRFFNNYRWIRDTYEDDGDDEDYRNSTNSEWEIYLTV